MQFITLHINQLLSFFSFIDFEHITHILSQLNNISFYADFDDSLEDYLIDKMEEYGYPILFIWSYIEGELGLLTAGVMSHYGKLNPIICIIVAAAGAYSSDITFFALGRYKKTWVRKKLHKQRRQFARAQILLNKHGGYIIFFQRYVYGLRTVIPITIGLTNYKFKKFLIVDAISATLWAMVTIIPAYFLGDKIMAIIFAIKDHWYYIIPIVIILILIMYYRRKKRKIGAER